MRSSIGPLRARSFACSLVLVSFGALAQEPPSNYATEYMKRLKVYQTVQPYGDKPFGEEINLYTGEVSFSHTDIVLEGTGPTIRVTRTRRGTGRDDAAEELHPASMFGDWTLELPRIDTLVADPRYVDGVPGTNWRMDVTSDAESYKRCTYFNPPYVGQSGILLDDWWHGYEITLGGGGSESLLVRNAAYPTKPAMTGAFPALTLSDVQVTCLPATKNGEVGEGFLAVAPDGTKYWFDWLVGTKATSVIQQNPQDPEASAVTAESTSETVPEGTEGTPQQAPGGGTMPLQQDRMQVSMFVTRIEDRFGNALTYSYNGALLQSITATDGRVVTFAWTGTKIASITVMPNTADARTWQYQYPSGNLGVVILPDTSRWTFNIGNIGGSDGAAHPTNPNNCTLRSDPNTPGADSTSAISTVTAPSGLVGTFAMQKRWHGRSYIGSQCITTINGSHEPVPPVYSTRSLYKRTISGLGVPASTWTYLYAPAAGSTRTDACYNANTCSETTWIDVVEPDGERTRYTSATRFNALEGKLVRTDTYAPAPANTLLRSEVTTYTLPVAGLPYIPNIGFSYTGGNSNESKLDNRTPIRQRVITQQGRNFKWIVVSDCYGGAVLCFNTFAQPIKINRTSTP